MPSLICFVPASSSGPRRHVREDVLLEAFASLELSSSSSSAPSRALYDLVLDLLFTDLHAQRTLHDTRARQDLFRILVKLLVLHVRVDTVHVDSAVAALERVLSALRAAPMLLAAAAARDWLSTLLVRAKHLVRAAEPLRVAYWSLVRLLCADHCTARHVRRLFRCLALADSALRALLWPPVLSLLRALWADSSVRSFFELEGDCSALLVPDSALSTWPTSGYTFALSVCLTAPSSPHARPAVPYTPYLCAFVHERSGVGIECLLVPAPAPHAQGTFVVALRALGKGAEPRLQLLANAVVVPQQWATIAFAHRPGSLLSRSSVAVALNGALLGTIPVAYPRPTGDAMSVARIAGSTHVPENAAHALRGRLAYATLYREAFTDAALQAVTAAGVETVRVDSARAVFHYEPRAVAGSLVVDVAHGDKSRHATLLGTAAARTTRGLQDALLRAQSLRTLLPLFAAEFRPRVIPSLAPQVEGESGAASSAGSGEGEGAEAAVLVQLLELLAHIAEHSAQALDEATFALLGHVLTLGSAAGHVNAWSARAVSALERLLEVCKSREGVWRALLGGVVLCAELWAPCAFAVQQQVLVLLAARANADPQRLRRAATVTQLLALADRLDASKPTSVARSRTQLRELRFLVLSTVRAMLGAASGDDLRSDLGVLVGHALRVRRHAVDVLQLLLTLLQEARAGVAEHLRALDAHIALVALLDDAEDDRCAVWVLKLHGQLYHAHTDADARTTALRQLLLLARPLQRRALTLHVYHALLEVACGTIALAGVSDPLGGKSPPRLLVPSLLGLAVSLAAHAASQSPSPTEDSIALLVRVLEDWQRLLATPAARAAALAVAHWWQPLLALYSLSEPRVHTLVNSLLSQLLGHALQTAAGEATLTEFRAAWALGDTARSRRGHLRSVVGGVVQQLALDSQAGQARLLDAARSQAHVWLGQCALLDWVASLLFELPVDFNLDSSVAVLSVLPLQVDRDVSGLWVDISLARASLELASALLVVPAPPVSEASLGGSSAPPSPSTPHTSSILKAREKALQRLQRLHVRLTMYGLEEAHRYQLHVHAAAHSDKALQLSDLLRVHVDVISDKALQRYLQSRSAQLTTAAVDVDALLRRSLAALQTRIASLASSAAAALSGLGESGTTAATIDESLVGPLLTLLLFLHRLVQRTPSSHAQLIATLRSLSSAASQALRAHLLRSREYRALAESLKEISELVIFLSKGFEAPSAFPLQPLLVGGVLRVLSDEYRDFVLCAEASASEQRLLTVVLEQRASQEARNIDLGDQRSRSASLALSERSQSDRARLEVAERTLSVQLDRDWRRLLRDLTSTGGPWSSIAHSEATVMWRLEATETRNRRRLTLVPASASATQELLALTVNADKAFDGFSTEGLDIKSILASPLRNLRSGPPKANRAAEQRTDDSDQYSPSEADSSISLPSSSSASTFVSSMTLPCIWIKPSRSLDGDLDISPDGVVFRHFDTSDSASERVIQIALTSISRVLRRRSALQHCALEIFTWERRSYFFSFKSDAAALDSLRLLIRLKPPSLEMSLSESPEKLFKKMSHITDAWRRREISNFDYLMELNTWAGRSYNDLSQYPVMPWVLTDYSSEKIDLTNDRVYRDLSKPVGALNPERLKQFLQRYEMLLDDDDVPPFYYGTHYSSAASVLFYLVRLQPFTSAALRLQDGRFDIPQRMFWSLSETWRGCLNNPSDVKELIPEFFYCSTMFRNVNALPLGFVKTPEGPMSISDVQLPPWANNDPDLFVQIHRDALESDYVSAHLHEWIDLIFGYKQRGDPAVQAHNVFYHLTYEGAVDFDSLEDPALVKSMKSQVEAFGQTPIQLTAAPHPRRLSVDEALKETNSLSTAINGVVSSILSPSSTTLSSSISSTSNVLRSKARSIRSSLSRRVSNSSLSKDKGLAAGFRLHPRGDSVALIALFVPKPRYVLSLFEDWSVSTAVSKGGNPFSLEPSNPLSTPTLLISHILNKVDRPSLRHRIVDCIPPLSIIAGGEYDGSLIVSNYETGVSRKLLYHADAITCLRSSDDGRFTITCSSDLTCAIWDSRDISRLVANNFADSFKKSFASVFSSEVPAVEGKPLGFFYGLEAEISALEIDSDLDLVVFGCLDSTCSVYSLLTRRMIRTISSPNGASDLNPVLLKISSQSYLVSYWESSHFQELNLHSLQDGHLLASRITSSVILAMAASPSGEFVVTGGENGCVTLYTLLSSSGHLESRIEWKCHSKIRSLSFVSSAGAENVLIGLESGELILREIPDE